MSDALAYAAARAIVAERGRLGLSQEAFGERIGLSRATVKNLELGKRPITLAELPVICEALQVPLIELLRRGPEDDLRKLGLA